MFAMREPMGMEKLREYLCNAGVTQRAFAETVGLSRSHLNEIISGRKRPSLDLAFAIARATSGTVSVEAWEPLSSDSDVGAAKLTSIPNQESSHDTSPAKTAPDAA